MLRNIRRFYWKQRDRGQGRKTVMGVLVFFLFDAIIVAAIIKSMMGGHGEGLQTVHKTNTATGAAVITETASGASVAATETAPDRELPQETKEAISVDTTNLSTFLGFMSDTAYEDLKNQLIQICQDRKCRSVKKLTYQQTKAFGVTSFVLLSDGSVYQCNYNLKSCQMSLSETSYDEVAVNQMKEKELQEEQAKLEQQQKAEREKLAKKKAVHKKKKEKRNHIRQKRTRKNRQKSIPDENIKNNAITTCIMGYKGCKTSCGCLLCTDRSGAETSPLQDMCMDVSTSCVSCKARMKR